ncbi:hypothetical protein UP10_33985 [Bradyrhizobium sp. LTSPM299]|uniref:hypothetical protein n=1 Tax=Bradyrhizobium sp. LTSPM299 TaxID=1619233 RepID=UPI0005CB5D89|nr:hypothetical protein [Bradyrhizobium sp. LTSPM299]KJC56534.1 hypothetical protein UP10_33985 [Bradyrhizobium sp. LTSPM299]
MQRPLRNWQQPHLTGTAVGVATSNADDLSPRASPFQVASITIPSRARDVKFTELGLNFLRKVA